MLGTCRDFGNCQLYQFDGGRGSGGATRNICRRGFDHLGQRQGVPPGDMWQQQSANYADTANVDNNQQEEIFKEAQWRMAKFVNRTQAVFHRNTSVDAALGFPDASVDFIYLDARHDYCGVTEDLYAWYPKLRVGGIMAGGW